MTTTLGGDEDENFFISIKIITVIVITAIVITLII